jgi:hypothetical protein
VDPETEGKEDDLKLCAQRISRQLVERAAVKAGVPMDDTEIESEGNGRMEQKCGRTSNSKLLYYPMKGMLIVGIVNISSR